jgi:hypothetical protein
MTPQTQANLKKFESEIQKFAGLWKSVRIFAMGAQAKGHWIAIAGRFVLSECPASIMKVNSEPVPEFVAYYTEIPFDRFAEVLTCVVEQGTIPNPNIASGENCRVLDFRLKWEATNWEEPRQWGAPVSTNICGESRACVIFQRQAGGVGEFIDTRIFQAVNAKLALRRPAYKDLDDLLAKFMPGYSFNWGSNPNQMIQIVAPLPFDMDYQNDEAFLTVKAPQEAFSHQMQLSVLFESESQIEKVSQENLADPDQDGMVEWRVLLMWPAGARQATAKLYFDEEFIEEVKFTRWKDTISLRVVLDSYFDPGHAGLRKLLQSTKPDDFECGVVKLLNILGVPAIWYGKLFNDRSDSAAVFQFEGKNLALLIECTRQKPANKFTPLLVRAKELETQLHGECEVVPIVFVTSAVSTADFEQAASDKIILADSVTVNELLELLKGEPKAADVLKTLRCNRIPFPTRGATLRY